MRTYDFNVYVLIADIGVNLIERPEARENGEGRRKGNKPAFRHTRRRAVHVLLGDTDVKESVGEPVFEFAYFGRTSEVGRKSNDIGVFLAQFDKSFTVNFRGCHFGTFNRRIC